jgi:galactose mutarotase-like enzyme
MTKNWILTDTKNGVYTESLSIDSRIKVNKRTLRGGVSDGVDVIEIDNGKVSLSVLPTRGMNIWKGTAGSIELKWDSPVNGPVHPSLVPVLDPGGLGFLEGFDEWFVRCGLESNGSPEWDENGKLRYPLHGRIANTPAHYVELTYNEHTGDLTLLGKVLESKLFFKKLELTTCLKMTPNTSRFTVQDTITNHSAEKSEFQLLYHINTGQPFASPDGRAVVPFNRMAPRTPAAAENLAEWDKLGPETPGSEEVVFFFEPAYDENGFCKTLLVDSKGKRAMQLSFCKEFPYFALWKSRLSNADGYVCGTEPAVNLPNNKSFEKQHGRVVPLAPGESKTYTMSFEFLFGEERVEQAEQEIRSIHGDRTVEPQPRQEWTP